MKTKPTIDLHEFNEDCKTLGLKPYPVEEVRFNTQDQDLFLISVRNMQENLDKWLAEQEKK